MMAKSSNNKDKRRLWSPEQYKLLENNPGVPAAELAPLIGVSVRSVLQKRYRAGLTEKRTPIDWHEAEGFYDPTVANSTIAEQVGCHPRSVQRARRQFGVPPLKGSDCGKEGRAVSRPKMIKPVIQVSTGTIFESLAEAAEAVSVTTAAIWAAIRYNTRCAGSAWILAKRHK